MITTGESDSHLDGIDGGYLAAARVEVLLEVRQEDSKARKICDLMSNHMASLIIETYSLIIIVITIMIMIITSQVPTTHFQERTSEVRRGSCLLSR